MRNRWSGGVWAVLCVAGFCAAVLCSTASAWVVKGGAQSTGSSGRKAELTAWQQAERALEELQAIPEGSRTKADYQRAMDGFRAVYHEAPGDVHAPDSVSAVAELLAEQGRSLHDARSSKAAVGQYEFLRTQYPGSSLRVQALLAEGQIYENDLHDAAAAKERYEQLVKEFPRSGLVEEAKAGIASLSAGSREEGVGSRGCGQGRGTGRLVRERFCGSAGFWFVTRRRGGEFVCADADDGGTQRVGCEECPCARSSGC